MEAEIVKNKKEIQMKAYRNVKNNPVVEVFDNGTGIHENIKDDIFVPFFTTKENGSGIGLSLVKQLVFLNKAKLSIKSGQEKGCRTARAALEEAGLTSGGPGGAAAQGRSAAGGPVRTQRPALKDPA